MKDKDEVVYAVGPEVEHTPVFGSKTLFVNGIRSVSQMIEFAETNHCKHICLGAFNSFQKNKKWGDIISELLASDIHVSIHYPADAHDFILENLDLQIWGHPHFIPVIVVKLPQVLALSKNLMLKIDDDRNGVNTGVWTSPMREVLDSNRFATWSDYDNIMPILTVKGLKKLQAK